MKAFPGTLRAFAIVALMALRAGSIAAEEKPFRLPAVDLKQPIIWGSECTSPDGFSLAFGGQNQKSEDGLGHTRIREKGGEWNERFFDLERTNPFQWCWGRAFVLRQEQKLLLAHLRTIYFEGLPDEETAARVEQQVRMKQSEISLSLKELRKVIKDLFSNNKADEVKERLVLVHEVLDRLTDDEKRLQELPGKEITARQLMNLRSAVNWHDRLVACFAAEPPPRALSPLVYEPKHKVFVLFGGDHLDYLTADTWIFDPATKRWTMRHPAHGPAPRANHTLKANGDGTISLSGGYTYTSTTDYMGGQYRNLDDGTWTFDIEKRTWQQTAVQATNDESFARTYRIGRLAQQYCWQDPRPNAAEFQATLAKLPENMWVETKTPFRPGLNRDWGTAVLDPQRDLILRFSGGHCAHGGSDVLQFHLNTNRWELPIDVEFPLGQLYTNTEYPEGFNFNRQPWVTGHTYQSYGYDENLRQMIFTGQRSRSYFYDPEAGDWLPNRTAKPAGMNYDSCYYTLTCTSTPQGLFCWTQEGRLFQFDVEKMDWRERQLTGEKLPGAVVDNSTMVYDTKRDRLLCCRKPYGEKEAYSGEWYAIDLKANAVNLVSPANKGAAAAIPYLCQIRYDAEHDLLLCGCTLPAAEGELRRTPAYDCATNRWVSLRITGDVPSPKGRNVSLGLMYDAKRKLFWAVDADSHVFVLRLNPATADMQQL